MKIMIDARWIFRDISGIGNYTTQLLAEFVHYTNQHEFHLLFNDEFVMNRTIRELNLSQHPSIKTHLVPWSVFSPAGQLHLPQWIRKISPDIFHSTNYMLPLLAFNPGRRQTPLAITTIHDLIPLRFPDHAPKSKKSRMMPLFKWIMRQCARRSSRILTVSDISARDIHQLLDISPNRIQRIYNGVSPEFHPSSTQPPPSPLRLIYIGRSDPYKNLQTLIKITATLNTQSETTLTLVGAPDPRYPEPLQLAATLGIADKVQWTGPLRETELIQNLHQAHVLVHPSLYEGFGLQIIEAMAAGTPVVCSNAGSLPEVAGDAAIMVDPHDVDAYIANILKLCHDPAFRADHIARGHKQAAKFTWRQTAQATLQAYATALSRNPANA